MNALSGQGATSLPLWMLVAGTMLWIFVTARAVKGKGVEFQFLYIAFSGRYLVNFFHENTARSVIGGQSINSLVTLTIVAVGLLLSRKHLIRFKAFIPFYLFFFVLAFSGLYNGQVEGMINALLRQMLFLTVVILFIKVLDAEPHDGSFAKTILSIFVTPLVFQVLSIAFNITHPTESDGSISYIGGYVHEGAFSAIGVTGVVFAVLANGINWKERTLYALIFATSIFFANYRTALLAALPMLFIHFVIGSGQGFRKDVAVLVRSIAAIMTLVIGALLVALLSQRFADIAIAAQELTNLIKPPSEFDSADRSLFSGRLLIWSDYVFTTLSGDLSHIIIGFGPDSWEGVFEKYAHNVYISYIYEVGVVGVVVYAAMTFSFLWMALTTKHPRRWALVSAHVGYLILSVGTMPTVVIEGVLLYATICGYTVYYKLASVQRTRFLIASNQQQFHVAPSRRRVIPGITV